MARRCIVAKVCWFISDLFLRSFLSWLIIRYLFWALENREKIEQIMYDELMTETL